LSYIYSVLTFFYCSYQIWMKDVQSKRNGLFEFIISIVGCRAIWITKFTYKSPTWDLKEMRFIFRITFLFHRRCQYFNFIDWKNIIRINHYIWNIVCFETWNSFTFMSLNMYFECKRRNTFLNCSWPQFLKNVKLLNIFKHLYIILQQKFLNLPTKFYW